MACSKSLVMDEYVDGGSLLLAWTLTFSILLKTLDSSLINNMLYCNRRIMLIIIDNIKYVKYTYVNG